MVRFLARRRKDKRFWHEWLIKSLNVICQYCFPEYSFLFRHPSIHEFSHGFEELVS
jgi:hypothetical protein